jgi:hypothetical protein
MVVLCSAHSHHQLKKGTAMIRRLSLRLLLLGLALITLVVGQTTVVGAFSHHDQSRSVPALVGANLASATSTSLFTARFVHIATAATIAGHTTAINNPATNGNPNALLIVTPNWNPGGTGGTYNNHAIGVWYNTGTSKWEIFNQDYATMPVYAAFNVEVSSTSSSLFIHTATAANSISHRTVIDSPATNGNPNALLIVTLNWNPGGTGGTSNNHPLGVWYNTGTSKWEIFNQDYAAMPPAAAFNVKVGKAGPGFFVHTAAAATIAGHTTAINNPATNGNPNALLIVTSNWNPGGTGGTFNNHAIGVWYNTGTSKWEIFNQDYAAMPANAAFNIKVSSTSSSFFINTATTANIISHRTALDSPATNGNPNALLIVTPNWNPGGTGGTYNNHPVGVWYNTGISKWEIFNEDLAPMPTNAAFNVEVGSTGPAFFVHTATATTISGHVSSIDHPALNSNPAARILVTPNWNPGGLGGVYYTANPGVYYTGSKWAIFSEGFEAMPMNAAFNAKILGTSGAVFIHQATTANSSGNVTYIDNPATNGNPQALVQVTQNWNPGGVGGTYNNRSVGVWYDTSVGKWSIFNQNIATMPIGAAFTVEVIQP